MEIGQFHPSSPFHPPMSPLQKALLIEMSVGLRVSRMRDLRSKWTFVRRDTNQSVTATIKALIRRGYVGLVENEFVITMNGKVYVDKERT